jgi:hypothetical protein
MSPALTPLPHVDVTFREFERRLADHGHSPSEIHELWRELLGVEPAPPERAVRSLGLGPMIAVYLGVLFVVAAIGSLLALYWDTLDPWGVLAVGVASLAVFLVASELLRRNLYGQPAAVVETVAVGFVPVIAYAIEKAAGYWPASTKGLDYIFDSVTVMIAAGVAAAIVLLAMRPVPLLVVPLAAGTAGLGADLAEAIFGNQLSPRERLALVLPVAIAWIAVGLWLDVTRRRDYATWAHWAGLLVGGVSLMILVPKTVPGFAVIGALGAIAMFFSALVRHWSFTIVGAGGVLVAVTGGLGMLGKAAPIAAAALGLALVAVGLRWWRWRDALRGAVLERLPSNARRFVSRLAPADFHEPPG